MHAIIGGCVAAALLLVLVIIATIWYCKKIKKNGYVNTHLVWRDLLVVEGNLEEVKLIGQKNFCANFCLLCSMFSYTLPTFLHLLVKFLKKTTGEEVY